MTSLLSPGVCFPVLFRIFLDDVDNVCLRCNLLKTLELDFYLFPPVWNLVVGLCSFCALFWWRLLWMCWLKFSTSSSVLLVPVSTLMLGELDSVCF